jgi:hypothetical protein
MKTLRLLLGDQLNSQHSWFEEINPDVVYVMAEMRQETDYVKHHIQKVVAFFLSMRNFSKELIKQGHQVVYYTISDVNNPHNLEQLISLFFLKYMNLILLLFYLFLTLSCFVIIIHLYLFLKSISYFFKKYMNFDLFKIYFLDSLRSLEKKTYKQMLVTNNK